MLLLLRTAFRWKTAKRIIFQSLMVWIMRLRSQPEALPSLVIMWGSIPFNVAQNDVHSAITTLPLPLSTRSSTAEKRCDARSTSV